jgi:sugar phosphate isomerase/epimerase
MPDLPLPDLLRITAELGIATLEFGCGNWPSTPHLKRDALLDSVAARNDFLAQLAARGLSTSALNRSGTPLHPSEHGRPIARPASGQSAKRACSASHAS